jgi:hypothetical protein
VRGGVRRAAVGERRKTRATCSPRSDGRMGYGRVRGGARGVVDGCVRWTGGSPDRN